MGGHRPAIDHLDGPRLRRALLSAAARLTAERDHLNAINLFPVADGDTGSNLAMTMEAVTAALTELAPDGAGDVLVCAAEAALDGARGNSGAILAQYLLGLAETLGDCRRLEPALLGPALSHAASQARSALADPQPGTMLTLMDAVAAAAVGTASDDLGTLMDAVRQASAGALLETRRMLAVHRAADVEDAGARGFFLLLEGMVAALSGHDPQPELDPGQAVRITPGGLHTPGCVDPARRYCSECVVSAQGIDAGAMRAELEHFADSVVVIGHARRVRVHAHVADPGRLFALAARHGRVSQEKVDDMIRQQDAVGRGQRVAIVTDSGADLPAELCDSLGIHLVPLRVNFGGRSYLDKAGLGSERFFSMLDEELEHPTTSQPAPADYRRLLGFLLDHHEHVIVLSLSSRISGTWQAARAAAERAGDQRCTVIDSRNLSLGQGLLAMRAAELARAGLGYELILDTLAGHIGETPCLGLVEDLRYAVRGGRIRPYHRVIAGLLGVRPLLGVTAEGQVRARGLVPRWRDPIEGLLGGARRLLRPGQRYRILIGHAARPEQAARLSRACSALAGVAEVHTAELGPTLGVHGGPGTLGLALQRLDDAQPAVATRGSRYPA